MDTIKLPVSDPAFLLRSLLSSSVDCIKILDLDGKLIYMTEGGQQVMEVPDFELVRGCPWPDFWQGVENDAAKAALESAKLGQVGHFIGAANTFAGKPKWWDVTVTLMRDVSGRPDKILSVSRDITESYETEVALKHNQQSLTAALAAADLGMWDFDPATDELRWDNRCRALFGISPGVPVSWNTFLSGLHPDDREATEIACLDAMKVDGSQSYDIEYRTIGIEDGIERWCAAKGRAYFENGRPIRFIGTIRDIGKLKEAERLRDLLTHELEHRLKNMMAMVGAIASQTFRSAPTKEAASANFDARLMALNRAHSLLTKSSWKGASMPAVVEAALAPHQTPSGQIHMSGPEVELSSKQALSLALALHELATNSVKYGALSSSRGTVDVHWNCACELDGQPSLSFSWSEMGGPPVSDPSYKGFGSRLIASTLSNDFGPTAAVRYEPTGLVCTFKTPMSFAAAALALDRSTDAK